MPEIVWERKNIKYLVVYAISNKERRFNIFYIATDGKFELQDSKGVFGTKYIEVKKHDIICIWTDCETGQEEFCGWIDISGKIIKNDNSTHEIPDHLQRSVKEKLLLVNSEYVSHPFFNTQK